MRVGNDALLQLLQERSSSGGAWQVVTFNLAESSSIFNNLCSPALGQWVLSMRSRKLTAQNQVVCARRRPIIASGVHHIYMYVANLAKRLQNVSGSTAERGYSKHTDSLW